MMKRYNLCVANYKNWLLNRDIIKLLDLKRVITKIKREQYKSLPPVHSSTISHYVAVQVTATST